MLINYHNHYKVQILLNPNTYFCGLTLKLNHSEDRLFKLYIQIQ